MDLRAIHLDDRATPRDLRWQRHPERHEVIQVHEWDTGYPGSTGEWRTVQGLEGTARRWGTCAGCGTEGLLIADPLTPGCEWCDRCSG
jgi:hypothetical protein